MKFGDVYLPFHVVRFDLYNGWPKIPPDPLYGLKEISPTHPCYYKPHN